MKYYINGWIESERYFFSFGFTEKELAEMVAGKIIIKGSNSFRIEQN